MKENIMYIPAIVLMVVEVTAFCFLVCAWFKAKGESNEK